MNRETVVMVPIIYLSNDNLVGITTRLREENIKGVE